jgi:hypothetical protein
MQEFHMIFNNFQFVHHVSPYKYPPVFYMPDSISGMTVAAVLYTLKFVRCHVKFLQF